MKYLFLIIGSIGFLPVNAQSKKTYRIKTNQYEGIVILSYSDDRFWIKTNDTYRRPSDAEIDEFEKFIRVSSKEILLDVLNKTREAYIYLKEPFPDSLYNSRKRKIETGTDNLNHLDSYKRIYYRYFDRKTHEHILKVYFVPNEKGWEDEISGNIRMKYSFQKKKVTEYYSSGEE